MRATQTGFTLTELLFTVAVVALLLGVGIPNLRDFLRNSRMTSSANVRLCASGSGPTNTTAT